MAKYTLLEVVNSYLDATDGFGVSDIDDTIESQQVVKIAEDIFNEVQTDVFNSSIGKAVLQLDSVSDSEKPNYLKIPDNVVNVRESTIRYNVSTRKEGESTIKYKRITFLHPEEFINRIGSRSTESENNEVVQDYSGVKFVIKTNKSPMYCTSFDDSFIVFDSYDRTVDTTLQGAKSQITGAVTTTFIKQSNWVIDLPEWFHSGYVNLVKSRTSEYLRQEPLFSDMRKGEAALIKARNKQRIGNSKFEKKRYGRRR